MSDQPSLPEEETTTAAASGIEPARTHQQAAELLRRPFAPGAVGFFAADRVELSGNELGGARVLAFVRAQSIVQRLNAGLPGRWTQTFQPVAPNGVPLGPEAPPPGIRMYLLGTLTVRLPHEPGGPDVEVAYQDVGEVDAGTSDALKALYSDARKRSALAAGIGAYLYTSVPRIALPVVFAQPAPPADANPHVLLQMEKLVLPAATERWLRRQYDEFVKSTEELLGAVLRHGEADESIDIVGEPVKVPTGARAGDGTARAAATGGPTTTAMGARLTAAADRLRGTIHPPEERETREQPAAEPAAGTPGPTSPQSAAAPGPVTPAPAAPSAPVPDPGPVPVSAARQPPPPPVQPVAQPPAGAGQEIGATGSLSPLTAEQQQWICHTAAARGMTAGGLVNLIVGLTGGQQRSDEVAARAFDEGFLASTPAYLFERIRAALDPAQQQLPTAPLASTEPVPAVAVAGTNGHVPVDFRGLGTP